MPRPRRTLGAGVLTLCAAPPAGAACGQAEGRVLLQSIGGSLCLLLLRVGSRAGAVTLGTGISCCRRLSHNAGASDCALIPFPAPATSYAACGFPALRTPARFMTRFMGPIKLGVLSTVAAWADGHGSARISPICRTATAYSTSSSRSPYASVPASSVVESSFPPSPAHSRSNGSNHRWQSN
jgi:hypothetical protein